MLTIRALSSFHWQAILQSLAALVQKPWISIMTILIIAISLALPAFFWVFTDNFSQATVAWQKNGHISLYLKPMKAETEEALLKTVRGTEGVGQAQIKSPEEGLALLVQQEGMHDIMRYLPVNPLPPVIEVIPALMVDSPNQLSALSKELKALPNVEQVKLDMEWVTKLHVILTVVKKIARTLMFLLSMAVLLIIGISLRLAIQNRQEEIQVLKLIGAGDAYIERPFLYSGIWYGFLGSLLAVLIVNTFAFSLGFFMNQLLSVYQMHYPVTVLSIRQILPLMTFAIILGWLAARLSVKRQLFEIEPYK